ncbi:hypothetical protein LSH36_300g04070 [Paralvinella palmiformis]|uniref:Uncharacterized protein n=1 Tax=Paralvinella palmiformis TaxID=53620 RepID=A0AAD9JHP0_9ANNE|nr:hypothetical protein LSH36_300g04070 [Paralvinella palmiformis]
MTEVQKVIRALQEQRDNIDTFHEKLYSLMVSTAESVNVEPGASRLVARQRHRRYAPAKTPAEYNKVNVTIPILDEILSARHGSVPFCQFQFHSIPFSQFQFHLKFINSNSIPIPKFQFQFRFFRLFFA